MPELDELINDFKLDATFHEGFTEHRKGDICERWKRERKLGAGGFGVVWLEREQATCSHRAVKIIQNASRVDFRKELLALQKFSRPKFQQSFVQFYGWYDFVDNGSSSIFLAMEYFPSGDLRSFIRGSGPLAEDDAMIIARQLAGGLRMLHEENFTHRDLKLENIFVVSSSPHWIIKIGDFGLAKQIQDENSALLSVVGTPLYQAPEQIEDERSTHKYTKAVDIWCLGHVLFELLTGRALFVDRSELRKFCRQQTPLPRQPLEAHNVSKYGINFITNLMDRDPSERPSASECWKWLPQYLLSPAVVPIQNRGELEEKKEEVFRPQSHLPDAASNSVANSGDLETKIGGALQEQQYFPSPPSYSTLNQQNIGKERNEAVRLLLAGGFDFRPRDDARVKALHWAAGQASEAAVKLLLDAGLDVDTVDDDGETALHHAARWGNGPVVRMLLGRGADADAMNKLGHTALTTAVIAKHEGVVRLLLETEANHETVNAHFGLHGDTALHYAARAGSEAIVRLLLEAGADIKAVDRGKQTTLHHAVMCGSEAVVRLLLEAGADSKAVDCNGETALHVAATRGSEATVLPLLEHGADIMAVNSHGNTALHRAVHRNRQNVVELLLEKGADIEATDKSGRTPLYYAAPTGHKDLVRLLVEKGADKKQMSRFQRWQYLRG